MNLLITINQNLTHKLNEKINLPPIAIALDE
jgi:hypothetical protein